MEPSKMWREKGKMWDIIGEYTLCSPDVPKDKSKFLNPVTPRQSAQRFEHTKLPTLAEWNKWPAHKQKELEEQEWERRKNGVWFWNDGVPTYITGRHYFYLNYHRYGTQKPAYREAGRRFFWWWQHIIRSKNCLGGYLHTRRRDGKTSRFASIGVEGATRIRFFRFGIQSKTEDSAREQVYEKEILPAIDALRECPWFMPDMAGSSRPKRESVFDTPPRQGKNAGTVPDEIKGLSSKIFWAESTVTALDGDGLTFHLNDEVGKKQVYNPYDRWSVVSKQFAPDGIVIGKGANTTTSDEKDGAAVEICKQFWDNSNQTLLGPNGINPDDPLQPTTSGLFRLFVPAYEGMLCDDYGRDTQAGIDHLMRRRAAVAHDPLLLLAEKRANPFTIDEALLPEVKVDCVFNAAHISDAMACIAEHDAHHTQPLVKRYRIYGEPGKKTLTEDPNGPIHCAWLPPPEWLNQVQQVGTVETALGEVPRYKPTGIKFGGSADPFDTVTPLKEGSKGAFHLAYEWDTKMEDRRGQPGYWPSHGFFVEVAERPADPDVYYQLCLDLCMWAGCKMFCEENKVNLSKYFRLHGCADFLARQPVATMSEAVKQQAADPLSKRTGASSSPRIIEEYTKAKVVFYQKYVGGPTSQDSVGNPYGPGYNDDGVPYDYRRMPFVRTMTQDLRFDPADAAVRKKSDLSVSHGFGLVHMTGFTIKPKSTDTTKGLTLGGVSGLMSMYRSPGLTL